MDSGIDFDIWDFNKGYGENSHQLFLKHVFMDAFCSVVKVLDSDRVFIMGGNENEIEGMPDTQSHTMIYNIKERTFSLSSPAAISFLISTDEISILKSSIQVIFIPGRGVKS